MADQLSIYNKSLGYLGERRLASSSEGREPKRVLDSYWSSTVNYCLAAGLWRFAKRTAQIDASTTLIPAFGFNFAFTYPPDWIRTVIVSTSPNMDPPLIQYVDEAGVIFANATPIYLAYVSNDPTYGMNLGAWPATFEDYVARRLASEAGLRITNGKADVDVLSKREDKARRVAKADAAMDDPPGMPPVPFWVRARRGAYGPGGLWFGSGGSGGTGSG